MLSPSSDLTSHPNRKLELKIRDHILLRDKIVKVYVYTLNVLNRIYMSLIAPQLFHPLLMYLEFQIFLLLQRRPSRRRHHRKPRVQVHPFVCSAVRWDHLLFIVTMYSKPLNCIEFRNKLYSLKRIEKYKKVRKQERPIRWRVNGFYQIRVLINFWFWRMFLFVL